MSQELLTGTGSSTSTAMPEAMAATPPSTTLMLADESAPTLADSAVMPAPSTPFSRELLFIPCHTRAQRHSPNAAKSRIRESGKPRWASDHFQSAHAQRHTHRSEGVRKRRRKPARMALAEESSRTSACFPTPSRMAPYACRTPPASKKKAASSRNGSMATPLRSIFATREEA